MSTGQKSEVRSQKKVRGRKGFLAALVLTSNLLLLTFSFGCGGPEPHFLSIATGGTGGVYYPYGGAVARLLTEKIPNTQVTAEATGASVDNLKLLQLGKVDLAFTLADTLAEAVKGSGPFASTGAIGSARTLAVLYTNYTHIVVRQGSGIKTVADLKGRVVSVGSPGSGTELIADRVLAAAGLDPRKDISRQALSVSESAGALKDGKLDALFWSGGLPTGSIQDLAATPGLSLTFVPSDDVLPFLQRDFGRELYGLAPIPADAYRGLSTDVATVGVKNLLVASSQLSDNLVAEILRVIFENKDTLVNAHPEARHLERPSTFDGTPAPYHPGAITYYKAAAAKSDKFPLP
jgi:TRAP transporter TAXI family solute receptor